MVSKKGAILAVLEVMQSATDENTKLKSKEIEDIVRDKYKIEINDRTVRNNLKILREFGYGISDYKEDSKGYYYKKKLLDSKQISAIITAVAGSTDISSESINEIIEVLKKINGNNPFTSKLLININEIYKCILENKKMSFEYYKYSVNKVLFFQNTYVVSPLKIIQNNHIIYLVCIDDKDEEIYTYFKIANMKNIEKLNKKRIYNKCAQTLDEFIKSSVYLKGGKATNVKLIIDKNIVENAIDILGPKVEISSADNMHFYVSVNKSIEGVKAFAMQHLNSCKVIEPEELAEDIKNEVMKYIKNS
ncbi:MAG: WYL domain-containing protein [Clostridia bacterium]